jgi:hypothetical protein
MSILFSGGSPFFYTFHIGLNSHRAEALGITQDQDHRIAAQEHLANEAVLFQ